jgi:mRNA interferase MazF
MASPVRGEVWLIDLGLVAKIRPCLILSVPFDDRDRALVTVVAHTTSQRGSRFEVSVKAHFLRAGAFDAQNLITISHAKLVRKLGRLDAGQLSAVAGAVSEWLGIAQN